MKEIVPRLEDLIDEAFGRGSALSIDQAKAPNCGWFARAWSAKGEVLLEAHGANRTLAAAALKKRIERRGDHRRAPADSSDESMGISSDE